MTATTERLKGRALHVETFSNDAGAFLNVQARTHSLLREAAHFLAVLELRDYFSARKQYVPPWSRSHDLLQLILSQGTSMPAFHARIFCSSAHT